MKFLKKLLPLKAVPTKQDEAKAFYKELEVDVMARTLWGEARSEGVKGLEAVAAVILNRVKVARKFSGYWWGNDIIQVCQKPYQFSCWNKSDPQYSRLLALTEEDKYFVTCKRIARRAVEGQVEDVTQGATHYHADYVSPAWADPRKNTVTIGRHIFYKLVEV
ncbi:MAG: hydrolase [Alphaproteobacteria bacterium]|nr:hydrolase [Alphaproteobacteria bacterium]